MQRKLEVKLEWVDFQGLYMRSCSYRLGSWPSRPCPGRLRFKWSKRGGRGRDGETRKRVAPLRWGGVDLGAAEGCERTGETSGWRNEAVTRVGKDEHTHMMAETAQLKILQSCLVLLRNSSNRSSKYNGNDVKCSV